MAGFFWFADSSVLPGSNLLLPSTSLINLFHISRRANRSRTIIISKRLTSGQFLYFPSWVNNIFTSYLQTHCPLCQSCQWGFQQGKSMYISLVPRCSSAVFWKAFDTTSHFYQNFRKLTWTHYGYIWLRKLCWMASTKSRTPLFLIDIQSQVSK